MKYTGYLKKIARSCDVPLNEHSINKAIINMHSIIFDVDNDEKLTAEERKALREKAEYVAAACVEVLNNSRHFISRRNKVLRQVDEVYHQWKKDSSGQLVFEDEYIRTLVGRLVDLSSGSLCSNSDTREWLKEELTGGQQ